jgi:hypothetical protein
MFCLASAGLERPDHAFVVDAVAEQMTTMLQALDALEGYGFRFPNRRVTVLATEEKAALGDRIARQLGQPAVSRALLDHPYYNAGLRFQIAAQSTDGIDIPLIDGGVFDWVAQLTSNRRAVYVASGLGSQLAALVFRHSPERPE